MRSSSSAKAIGQRLITRASRSSGCVCPNSESTKDWDVSSQTRRFQVFSRSNSLPGALAMAKGRPIAVFPTLALPLMLQKRFSSFEAEGVRATGGIVEIPLAQTGEGIADCEVIRWFVSEGDMVEEFAPVCEVQSDKASVVITSRYKGKVSQILHHPGDIVKVGETLLELMLLSEGSLHTEAPNPNSEKPSISDPEPNPVTGKTLLELMLQSEGSLHTEAPNPNSEKPSISDPEPNPVTNDTDHPAAQVLATPAVRSLAKDYGLDLHDIPGSGPRGRITKADVLHYVSLRENAQDDIQSLNEAPIHEEPQDFTPVPRGVVDGGDTYIPVRGHRRAMARAMTAAAAVPHFYYVEEIAMDKLTAMKRSVCELEALENVKLTYLPFLIKSLSMALKKFPIMNSTVDEAITQIQVRAAHNIGIAMATNHGLVVPNIKNVQRLSVLEIATELSRLIQLANTNSLSTEDITGGTITVSNFGAIGGKFGMPTLNVPEVAIVAIGRMQPVVRSLELDQSHVINVTWGADHRVIDGATVAHFCNEWKLLIEQPELLVLTLQ